MWPDLLLWLGGFLIGYVIGWERSRKYWFAIQFEIKRREILYELTSPKAQENYEKWKSLLQS